MGKRVFKLNLNELALFLVFVTGSLRWLFAGIAGGISVQIGLLFITLLLCIFNEKIKYNRMSFIWVLYGLSLFINIFVHHLFDSNTLKSFIIIIELIIFSIIYPGDISSYKKVFKILVLYGLINAISVMIHYAMGDSFLNIYGKILNADGLKTANNYVHLGHYFGFNFLPADTAGSIVFSMAAIVFWIFFSRAERYRRKKIFSFSVVVLMIPLLLTGKKGILFLSIAAFALTILIMYASKKQWIKAIKFASIGILIIFVAYYYITTHQDVELFQRLNTFFTNFISGENYDSNRYLIWGYALDAWSKTKFFGIGWKTFTSISMVIFGSGHEVNCDYLQILCETGILGAVLTFIPVFVMLYRTIITCNYSFKFIQDRIERWIALCSCFYQLFILLYASIEIPFYDTAFFSVYILTATVINKYYKDIRHT